MLTVEQVGRLAEAIGARYQALVLLAPRTFASLRWGELAALTRQNVDLDACTVRVVSSLTETDSGTLLPGLPKSAAGRRTVQLPPLITPSLRNHLDRYAQPGDDGSVFVSPRGERLRRQLPPPRVAARAHQGRPARDPLPRPAPYRQHPDRYRRGAS